MIKGSSRLRFSKGRRLKYCVVYFDLCWWKCFWTQVLGSCFKCPTKGLQLKHYLLGDANNQVPTAVPGTQVLTQRVREGVRSRVPVTHPVSPPLPCRAPITNYSCSFSAEMTGLLSPATRLLLVFCPALDAGEVPGPVYVHKHEFKSVQKNRGFSKRGVRTASATQMSGVCKHSEFSRVYVF